jgi:hypothetical protein
MSFNPSNQSLAKWILSILQAETTAGSDVLAYALATFGTDDLSKIVTAAGNADIDSLLDLIFFPDLTIQISFEKKWGAIEFSRIDEAEIITRLSEMSIPSTIICTEYPTSISIHLPFWIPEAFVQRLNITWQPDARIRDTLDRCLSPSRQIITRIHLRNAGRLCQTHTARPHQAGLISAFIEKMPPASDDYEPCLLFLLTILSEFTEGQPPYDFLISKKGHYFQCLYKAEDFERRRRTTNMETLMMQGERAAYGGLEHWRRCMQRIDTICNALFGHTHFFGQPRDVHTVIQPADKGWDMDLILRSLP